MASKTEDRMGPRNGQGRGTEADRQTMRLYGLRCRGGNEARGRHADAVAFECRP